MTITEVSEKYKIPLALLQRYATEKADAESKEEEVAAYLRLRQDGENSAEACLNMLNKLRSRTLDMIHGKEKALERIDYLRYELQTKKKGS